MSGKMSMQELTAGIFLSFFERGRKTKINSIFPNRYRELGNVISKTAKRYGVSVVRTYCGHGTGKFFHCAPNVPHYEKNKAVGTMKKGHVGFFQ